MRDIDLFQLALGLQPPWRVVASEFNLKQNQLSLKIDFPRSSTFDCPACGKSGYTAYDTERKTWRHLNFFQHKAFLTARVPRIDCPDCGVKTVSVPWARPKSGFTLLFEAYILTLATSMPVKTVAAMVNETDQRLWRVLHHYVKKAREKVDYSSVRKIGVDETSKRRGHNYVSVFADLDDPRVLYVADGKDSETIEDFKADLVAHNGDSEAIQDICCDMSPAFISGIESEFPNAQITFDKFHVIKILNDAVDQVRRQELTKQPALKKTRYLWLKNPNHLTLNQKATIKSLQLKKMNLKTARAYQIKLNFQEFYHQSAATAEAYLKKWYFWATHSRLEPIKDAAYTIKRHWNGILRWFTSKINNGLLEGINGMIQAAKARARGYRTTTNLMTMIYFLLGKLKFDLPY